MCTRKISRDYDETGRRRQVRENAVVLAWDALVLTVRYPVSRRHEILIRTTIVLRQRRPRCSAHRDSRVHSVTGCPDRTSDE